MRACHPAENSTKVVQRGFHAPPLPFRRGKFTFEEMGAGCKAEKERVCHGRAAGRLDGGVAGVAWGAF